jgi:hypothetical protein
MGRSSLFLVFILFLGGCIHHREQAKAPPLPDGAPNLDALLSDIDSATSALQSLESTTYLRLESPAAEGVLSSRTARIHFRRPGRFFAQIRKGHYVARLHVDETRFIMELGFEKVFYHGREGERFEELVMQVAPSQIVRELFILEPLGGADSRRVRLSAFDPEQQTAVLNVYRTKRKQTITRRIDMVQDGGWRIASVTVFDAGGTPVAVTQCSDYREIDDVVLPASVTATFPTHGTEMRYSLSTRKTKVNRPIGYPMKDLDVVRKELLAKGYTEISGIPESERR